MTSENRKNEKNRKTLFATNCICNLEKEEIAARNHSSVELVLLQLILKILQQLLLLGRENSYTWFKNTFLKKATGSEKSEWKAPVNSIFSLCLLLESNKYSHSQQCQVAMKYFKICFFNLFDFISYPPTQKLNSSNTTEVIGCLYQT